MNGKTAAIFPFLLIGIINAHFHSQVGQDKFVYERYFKDKHNGVFIDIGAHDGITFSNTYFFEKELGWKGICIEPQPLVFKQLERNRSCICINGCISDKSGTVDFTHVICPSCVYVEMLSGITQKYDPAHIARIDREVAQHHGRKEVIKVSAYLLSDILHCYGINHVNYLSIDTEGGELSILQTIPFERIIIDVIDVENNYGDKAIEEFLEAHGFVLVKRLEWDDIYARKAFLEHP